MKKNKLLFLSAILFAFTFFACNKSKKFSNRLIKAGEWHVVELSVDGVNEAELPEWHIEDCDIYEESCFGEWENAEGGHAEFIWQFNEKGKTFIISRQEGEHEHTHDHASEEANEQCLNFSGNYEVITHRKNEMEFKSSTTYGYNGKTVIIKIEKH